MLVLVSRRFAFVFDNSVIGDSRVAIPTATEEARALAGVFGNLASDRIRFPSKGFADERL